MVDCPASETVMTPLLVQFPANVSVPPLIDWHRPWLIRESPVVARVSVWPMPALKIWRFESGMPGLKVAYGTEVWL